MASVVVIASGDNTHLVDALGAGPLAVMRGAPVLLATLKTLPPPTVAEIKRLGATTAYIIGTTDVISAAVETALKAAGIVTVIRLGGTDRYATAAAISAEMYPTTSPEPPTNVSTSVVDGAAFVDTPTVEIHEVPPQPGSFTHGVQITTTNVGYLPTGVTLTPYTGPTTITTAGTVIEGKTITTGSLKVFADNVTIRRCLLVLAGADTSNSGIVVGASGQAYGKNFLLENCEVTSQTGRGGDGYLAACDRMVAVFSGSATFRRNYLHGSRTFIRIFPDNYPLSGTVLIEENFIGPNVSNSPGHVSSISSPGESSNVIVRRNRLYGPGPEAGAAVSGCFAPYPEASVGNGPWTIDSNHIDSRGVWINAGYTQGTGTPNHNFTITNNYLGHLWADPYAAWPLLTSNGVKIGSAWDMPTPGNNVWTNNVLYPEMTPIGHP